MTTRISCMMNKAAKIKSCHSVTSCGFPELRKPLVPSQAVYVASSFRPHFRCLRFQAISSSNLSRPYLHTICYANGSTVSEFEWGQKPIMAKLSVQRRRQIHTRTPQDTEVAPGVRVMATALISDPFALSKIVN
jgi:hypothetical protein